MAEVNCSAVQSRSNSLSSAFQSTAPDCVKGVIMVGQTPSGRTRRLIVEEEGVVEEEEAIVLLCCRCTISSAAEGAGARRSNSAARRRVGR